MSKRSHVIAILGFSLVCGVLAAGVSVAVSPEHSVLLVMAACGGFCLLVGLLTARRSRGVGAGAVAGFLTGTILLVSLALLAVLDVHLPGVDVAGAVPDSQLLGIPSSPVVTAVITLGIGTAAGMLGVFVGRSFGPRTVVTAIPIVSDQTIMALRNGQATAEQVLEAALSQLGDDLAIQHPWLWEGNRWMELVFALLTRVATCPERDIRAAAEQMRRENLLDIPSLANLSSSGSHQAIDSVLASRIQEVLREHGFTQDESTRGLSTMQDAAVGLQEHYGGKIQRYLRHYGELMLRDVSRVFQFNSLSGGQVGDAFTYWFQNALSLPLSLIDGNLVALAHQQGLDPHRLIEAADAIDLNVALLDDLVQQYLMMHASSQISLPAEAAAGKA